MAVILAGYKQTEVGLVPEDWEVTPFLSIGSVIDGDRGANYPGSRDFASDGHCLFLNAGNVTKAGFRFNECAFINREKDERLSKGKLKRGDIVLTTRGTVGNFAHFDSKVPFENIRINSGMVILRRDSAVLDIKFLYAQLQSHVVEQQVERLTFGSAQPQLTVKGISKFSVVLPPLPEQRAIAAALSDVDALLAKLDQLIAKKRDLKQATMQQLLTGQTRLPGFSGVWEVKRLGDVSQLMNGFAFKSSTYNEFGRYKVVTIANVQDGFMNTEVCNKVAQLPQDIQSHQCLTQGDILISMTGNVGRVCRVCDDNCLLNQRVGKLIPVGIDGSFLFAILHQPSFLVSMANKAKGGAQGNLSKADITEYELNLPPSKEQTAIATVLSDMDAELAALKTRRDKTRTLKQGMMQELLTGRIRLN